MYKRADREVTCLLYEYKDECRDTEYLILTDYKVTNTQAKYQNIKFLTTYCFVFLQKMQPGGLFQVNEATNVFFMILRDCFISENAINLSPQ